MHILNMRIELVQRTKNGWLWILFLRTARDDITEVVKHMIPLLEFIFNDHGPLHSRSGCVSENMIRDIYTRSLPVILSSRRTKSCSLFVNSTSRSLQVCIEQQCSSNFKICTKTHAPWKTRKHHTEDISFKAHVILVPHEYGNTKHWKYSIGTFHSLLAQHS